MRVLTVQPQACLNCSGIKGQASRHQAQSVSGPIVLQTVHLQLTPSVPPSPTLTPTHSQQQLLPSYTQPSAPHQQFVPTRHDVAARCRQRSMTAAASQHDAPTPTEPAPDRGAPPHPQDALSYDPLGLHTSAHGEQNTSQTAAQAEQAPKDSLPPEEEKEDDSLPVRAALAMLAFYRSALSPLMSSTCRYQPTCSNYSIQSYKKFGVWRGSVLTAWRLLRCSPLGSSGYDPPMWPPPGLALVYGPGTWEYNPHVTCVVGAALLAWIAEGLWTEITHIL